MILTETAYAKVNLALHVRRRRDDGYHELETIFAFCADGDVLSAEPADATTLTIDGLFAAGLSTTDNLVIRAAEAMGVTARLHLTKNLPVASGIGGGSADAAAALRLLARLTGKPLPLIEAQCKLGADVPACVQSRAMRGDGVGDVMMPLAGSFSGVPLLLVNPGVAVSTASVFRAWDGIDRGPLAGIGHPVDFDYVYDGPAGAADPERGLRNDLLPPALALASVIGDVLAALYAESDVLMTRMSGSGATCFATFADDTARDAAHAGISAAHPDWWLMATHLR